MNQMLFFRKSVCVVVSIMATIAVMGRDVSGSDRILLPENIVCEELDNGLDYYLVHNASPKNMIEFRLMFRTGSVLENNKNRGSAHFLEHMAFKGTKHFPERTMIEWLESLGIQYGVGINAFTGYDRTIYMFSMPAGNEENIDKALLVLKDWLVDITLDKKKVNSEKGVILEELRGYDVGDEFYDLKIGNGPFSKGIPLGTEKDIAGMTPRTLKKFHDSWYTLDRAAIAVVGDTDMDYVASRIKEMFSGLKATKSAKVGAVELTYMQELNYQAVRDELCKRTTLELILPHVCTHQRNLDDAVEEARERMLVSAMTRRFSELRIHAMVSDSWYLGDKNHLVLTFCEGNKEEVVASFNKALAESYRMSRDGFTSEEMEIAINKIIKTISNAYSSSSSDMICEDIVDDVIFGQRNVVDESQLSWYVEQLEATTSEDLVNILRSWLHQGEKHPLAAYRYNPNSTSILDKDEIAHLWEEAVDARTEKYEYKGHVATEKYIEPMVLIPASLLVEGSSEDVATTLKEKHYYPEIKVTDVLFKNGFRLVMRPTLDDDHKVQMQLFAPGGLSLIPIEQYPLYQDVAGYMELGGIQAYENDDDFAQMMMQNNLGIVLAMENIWHGIIASAPSRSVPLLFNVVREKMLSPRLNHSEFNELKEDELEEVGQESYLSRVMKFDYERQIGMQIDSLMGSLLYGRRFNKTCEDVKAMNLNDIAAFYDRLYGNPDGMTCVVCGDFDVDKVIAQAAKSFASIPARSKTNVIGPTGYTMPDQSCTKSYPNNNETQTMFDYVLYGKYEPSLRGGMTLKLMNTLIRNRLINVLREQMSLVYSPYISLFYDAQPHNMFYYDINASVDRRNTEKVMTMLKSLIADLQLNPVSKEELDAVKKSFHVNKNNYLQEDATSNWRSHIVLQLKNRESLADFENYDEVLESITPTDVRDAFASYIDLDRYMIFSLGDM